VSLSGTVFIYVHEVVESYY